jgi:hypothetical protein
VVNFEGAERKVQWKIDIKILDLQHYLPVFFEGLREEEDPMKFLADAGIDDLILNGKEKLLPVLPQLILPIKKALQTKKPEVVVKTLKKIQLVVKSSDVVAEALVPYYRQILPVLNLMKNRNKNLGDAIEYGQKKGANIGDLITQTLELMEKHGGEDAFINIKYMVPTY